MINDIILRNSDDSLLFDSINTEDYQYNPSNDNKELNLLSIKLIKKNNKKINVVFFLMLTLLTLQALNLIAIVAMMRFTKKINLSGFERLNSINTTDVEDYTNKIEIIVNYLCENYIQC